MTIENRPLDRRGWFRIVLVGLAGASGLLGCGAEGEGTIQAKAPAKVDHRTRLEVAKETQAPKGPPPIARRRRR